MAPAQRDDLGDWITSVEGRLRLLAGRSQIRPAQSSAITDDITIGPTKALKVQNAAGSSVQFLLGQDGAQRVARLYRTDGSIAFSVATATAAPQAATIWDLNGAAVVHDDPTGGGLARPYIPWVYAPARTADWLASTAAAFEDIYRMTVYKINPTGFVTIGHIADAATAGEVRVTVNAAATGATTTVGTSQGAVTVGPFALPGAQESTVEIRVQARRTSGAGSVRCAVLAASGYHS